MAPTPAPTASAKARAPPQTAPATRATRSRGGAKETPSATPVGSGKPGGLLARGKEGLRKVSDKIKEKEKVESKKRGVAMISEGESSEALKAFLRIRPPPEIDSGIRQRPYLEIQNDKEVLMRAPMDPTRPTIPKAPLIFSFDKVFPPSSPQSTFFSQTTLPLVDKLLHGENGLLFAYGVTNSGKSYTISGGGGNAAEEKGVLPRAVDVVFNSIEGMESKANITCVGTGDIAFLDEPEPALPSYNAPSSTSESIKVDRNYSYAVFMSYAEVYNDKIFDLLDSSLPSNLTQSSRRPSGVLPRPSSQPYAQSSMNLAAIANGGAGILKRRVLQLKPDPEGNGKYISGLNEIRVRTRGEALSIFQAGESARQVFSTLSNRESSRSHGIFTIKVVRIHNGAPNDPDSAQVSRLAIVDLAGSERNKNTGTSGDRLKEAGNINKSLMVLGQCLETLRTNQQKSAMGGKKLAMVPFRHSKLTEIFQNFFVGDGRAVMIVNVNPYDTGFDENSHVMRFSAVAREVQTTASNKVTFPSFGLKRQISSQFSAFKHAVTGTGGGVPARVRVSVPVLASSVGSTQREFASAGGGGGGGGSRGPVVGGRDSESFVMVEEELEVIEEPDEDDEDEDDEEDGTDVLVDSLFDQLREMKTRLYEAELHNATMEAEIRDEMTNIHQAVMAKMQSDHLKRIQELYEANEIRADKKIDIVTRMTPGPSRRYRDETPLSSSEAGETSFGDDSFTSALTDVISPSSALRPRESDPFVVNPSSRVPGLTLTRSSDQRDQLRDSRGEVDDELVDDALDTDGDGSEGDETELDISSNSLGKNIADKSSPVQTALPARPATSAVISTHPLSRTQREETAESDDILGNSLNTSMEPPGVEESDSDLSNEDSEDEEEEEGEGEGEVDTGDQADQDSSFDSSIDIHADDIGDESSDTASDFEADSSESEEERITPIRRASRVRRTTGSPKKRSPVKKAVVAVPAVSKNVKVVKGTEEVKTPVKKGRQAGKKSIAKQKIEEEERVDEEQEKENGGNISSDYETARKKGSSSPVVSNVLGERVGQDGVKVENDVDEDEEEVVVVKPKKKRTLGKKVIMEDDMINSPVVGAEIKRMARG